MSQYPVSADATSPPTRIAMPIPADATVVQRISRRCLATEAPARYWREAYHIQMAAVTTTNIIASAVQITGYMYPTAHVTNGVPKPPLGESSIADPDHCS
jgi:hypothetical protein